TNTADDAHNTISLGIAPGDGTLHVSFDHHTTSQGSSNLHYRVSVAGLVTKPTEVEWSAKSFGAVKSELVSNKTVTSITYPRFVTEAGGQKMLFSARIGESGSGDEYLWEYDASAHAWTELGRYIDGTSNNINAYLHSLSYTRGGTRLHASWCWRDTSNASTNHDLLYVYSDDHGRTWKNNAGTQIGASGTTAINRGSSGLNVWPIKVNRGLINQEHMAIDSAGRVHVLLGHMPDNQADDSNFDSARTKSQYFHYWRDSTGKWTRTSIAGLAVIKNFRGKLAIASSDNVYAVLPGMRIAGASASSNFATWTLLTTDSSRTYFSDPLIDSSRLETENKLTVYYPQASSKDIWGLEYTIQ
ncbi:MAG TPA: BNR repeat-containing protein, partial [Polyangiaceae bacterium]|nr:BNR repeat-containing protein [Polyangiaceae bacterium]